jgi:phage baseplate assembly protein W
MELYIRTLDDPNFDPRKLQSQTEIAQLLTQIETILFTTKGDVLGKPNFGANLEDLLFEFNLNEETIQASIERQLATYCPLAQKYKTEVIAKFYKDGDVVIATVDVVINNQYAVRAVIN